MERKKVVAATPANCCCFGILSFWPVANFLTINWKFFFWCSSTCCCFGKRWIGRSGHLLPACELFADWASIRGGEVLLSSLLLLLLLLLLLFVLLSLFNNFSVQLPTSKLLVSIRGGLPLFVSFIKIRTDWDELTKAQRF